MLEPLIGGDLETGPSGNINKYNKSFYQKNHQ